MLFLGLLFEKSEEHIIAAKSKGGFLQNQVNTFQWNCIDGLYENGVKNLTVINALPVGTYPRMYSEAIIHAKEWKYNGNTHFQILFPLRFRTPSRLPFQEFLPSELRQALFRQQ